MSKDNIKEVQISEDIIQILDANVVKSNDMIRKTQMTLTIRENRIVNYMISKIPKDADHFDYVDISFEEFSRICGLSASSQYHIKQTVFNLFNKSLNILQRTTDKDGKVHEAYVPLKWLDDYVIELNKKSIRLKFHERLGPLLLQLKGNYTMTQLYTYLAFKCKYSAPIYDMCRSCLNFLYKNNVDVVDYRISLEEFRERIAATKKLDRFYDLQKRILEPVLEEINTLSELNVDLVLEKKDRVVVNLVFKISQKPPIERIILKNRITESLIYPNSEEKDKDTKNLISSTTLEQCASAATDTNEQVETIEEEVSIEKDANTADATQEIKTVTVIDQGAPDNYMLMKDVKDDGEGQISIFEYMIDPDMFEQKSKKTKKKKASTK